VRSSAHLLVSVVTRVRCPFSTAADLVHEVVDLVLGGSTPPADPRDRRRPKGGLLRPPARHRRLPFPGWPNAKITCGTFSMNSPNRSGHGCPSPDGTTKHRAPPASSSPRSRSPHTCPSKRGPRSGLRTRRKHHKSSGKKSKSVYGASPGSRPERSENSSRSVAEPQFPEPSPCRSGRWRSPNASTLALASNFWHAHLEGSRRSPPQTVRGRSQKSRSAWR